MSSTLGCILFDHFDAVLANSVEKGSLAIGIGLVDVEAVAEQNLSAHFLACVTQSLPSLKT